MEPKEAAPDGGWGWMVVIGAALINMVNQAMFANFGLIFGEKLKDMADGHATGITLVMAMNVVVTNITGLAVGPLLKIISLRNLTFIGIACTGSGLIISSFATEIWHIIIGYSFMTGLGLGLLASGTFLVINDYFTTKKSTAVGISMAGTSIGQMLMPTFIGMLLKKYEFSGTTFILGFVSYTGIIGAMFFEPIFCCKKCAGVNPAVEENGKEMRDINGKDVKNPEEEMNLLNQKNQPPQKTKQGMIKRSMDNNYWESAIEVANSKFVLNKEEEKHHFLRKIARALGLEMLTDYYFVFIVIGLGFIYISSVTFNTFNPMFLQDEAELTVMQTTSCMTALSSADVLGRITVPEISRRLHLTNKSTFILGSLLLSIARSCMVEMVQFEKILAVTFIIGYFRAISVVNQNLVISEYISKEKLPSAIGLNMVVKAVMSGTIGQSLGLLKDQFSYRFSVHVLDIGTVIVVASWIIEASIRNMSSKKTEKLPEKTIEKLPEKTIQET
ncbi:hypothetical protein JTB14_021020 [Gonioctena quinquepunctata]|nr:hypothetical protein JTB14_021020 [Gonioctena quinquepunctata]